ncbi:MAG: sulfite exporter TauE/SafE family protein [Nitrospiraceae bacterium]
MTDSHGLTIMGLGFVLGLRHALDADHIVAVSTVLAERPSLRASGTVGLFWGLGHTLTLLLVGMFVLALRISIPESLAAALEFCIGLMLVFLGLSLARRLYREEWHVHPHEHGGRRHVHLHRHALRQDHAHAHWFQEARRPLLIGMAHGLAGSAALLLMVVSAAGTVFQGMGYILIFGIGSIIGMIAVGTAISLPFVLSLSIGRGAFIAVQGVASLGSIGLGLLLMWRLSLGESGF